MIRFEVALAIIGIVVAVMAILIGFEITFPTQVYYDQYKMLSNAMFEYKKRDWGTIRVEGSSKNYVEVLDDTIKGIKTRTALIFVGVGIVAFLIFQAFIWQIDPKTAIIISNFWILIGSLLGAFAWVSYLILFRFYKFSAGLFKSLIREAEEEIKKDQKRSSNNLEDSESA